MARELGPAQPRGVRWNGAGAWLIASLKKADADIRAPGRLRHAAARPERFDQQLRLLLPRSNGDAAPGP